MSRYCKFVGKSDHAVIYGKSCDHEVIVFDVCEVSTVFNSSQICLFADTVATDNLLKGKD